MAAAIAFIGLCVTVTLMQTQVLGFKCIRETISPNAVNEGFLHSPNYPREYPSNVCHIWYHMVSRETKVVIEIQDLDIPSIDNCRSNSSNRLLIGPHDKRQFCGTQRSGMTYEAVISDYFYVVFIITESYVPRGRGFVLHYKLSIPGDESDTPPSKRLFTTMAPPRHIDDSQQPCLFTMSDSLGVITIPKDVVSKELKYSGDTRRTCSWLLQTPDNHMGTPRFRYAFWFTQFHFNPDCCSLDIFEGSGPDRGRLVGHYISGSHPHSLYASGPRVFIKLTFKNLGYFGNFTIRFRMEEICRLGYKLCSHNESSCYLASKRCDGVWDCPLRGGDERGCTASCSDHKFSCGNTSAYCFSEDDRCNGKGTCSNYKDEQDCTTSQCSSDKGLFLCRNKRCIYEKWRCDHTKDCEDGSDEEDCDRLSSPRLIIACVVGTLISSLLLVLALSFAMRMYTLRMRRRHGEPPARHDSPLSRIEEDLLRRRAPPPQYNEAMMTSRSYDEAYLELLSQGQANNFADNSQEGNNGNNNNNGPGSTRRERSGRRCGNRRRSGRDRRLHRNLRTQQHLHGCAPLLPPPPPPLHHFTEQPPSYSDSTTGTPADMLPQPPPPSSSSSSVLLSSENHLSVVGPDFNTADGRNHELQPLSAILTSSSTASNNSVEPVPPPYSLHNDLPSASSESDEDDDDIDDDDDDDMIDDVDEDDNYINRNFSSSSSSARRADGDDNCLLLRGGNTDEDDDNLDDEDDEEDDTCLSVIPESTHSHLVSFSVPPLPPNTTISSDLMIATELAQMSSIIKEDDTDDDDDNGGVEDGKKEDEVVVAGTKDNSEDSQTQTLQLQDDSNSNVAHCSQKEKGLSQNGDVNGRSQADDEDGDDDECILSGEVPVVEGDYDYGEETSDTACLLAS